MLTPTTRPPRRPSPAPVDEIPPYYYRATGGPILVANPNRCLICRKPRHTDTAHHPFEPDVASPAEAARLGWPTPTTERVL